MQKICKIRCNRKGEVINAFEQMNVSITVNTEKKKGHRIEQIVNYIQIFSGITNVQWTAEVIPILIDRKLKNKTKK